MTTLSDLSVDLVGEIFSRVPLISLSAVRYTCKTWNALSWNVLSENLIFGIAATSKQFLGFVIVDYKVCSLRLDLQGIHNNDFVDPSIKEIDILHQHEISNIFHCDGLLLCVVIDGRRRKLMVWNPYLGQFRWIQPRSKYQKFHRLDMYAFGYDNNKNRNHKILRKFLDDDDYNESSQRNIPFKFEMYYFNSESWRVLDVNPDCDLRRGVSLKGNTYSYARQIIEVGDPVSNNIDFLLCFDFIAERFGPRLSLPFHSYYENTVTLSCVREEQLAVLYEHYETCLVIEIWITTNIEPNVVSWTKFFKMAWTPLSDFSSNFHVGSFFIDEEKKILVSKSRKYRQNETCGYETVNIIGQDGGYFKSVKIGTDHISKPENFGYYCDPLVFSSYVPSLVQVRRINQLGKRKERHY